MGIDVNKLQNELEKKQSQGNQLNEEFSKIMTALSTRLIGKIQNDEAVADRLQESISNQIQKGNGETTIPLDLQVSLSVEASLFSNDDTFKITMSFGDLYSFAEVEDVWQTKLIDYFTISKLHPIVNKNKPLLEDVLLSVYNVFDTARIPYSDLVIQDDVDYNFGSNGYGSCYLNGKITIKLNDAEE